MRAGTKFDERIARESWRDFLNRITQEDPPEGYWVNDRLITRRDGNRYKAFSDWRNARFAPTIWEADEFCLYVGMLVEEFLAYCDENDLPRWEQGRPPRAGLDSEWRWTPFHHNYPERIRLFLEPHLLAGIRFADIWPEAIRKLPPPRGWRQRLRIDADEGRGDEWRQRPPNLCIRCGTKDLDSLGADHCSACQKVIALGGTDPGLYGTTRSPFEVLEAAMEREYERSREFLGQRQNPTTRFRKPSRRTMTVGRRVLDKEAA